MIKILVMDVDGTLTDGRVYIGFEGETIKAFDIKDGCGIKILLPQQGIVPVVITARESVMLKHRCKELNIVEIHQGVTEKLICLNSILEKYSTDDVKYNLSNVAYIGDDILDLQCMIPIKDAGGIAGCPSDAIKQVVQACDYVSEHKAGEGAVRDFVEFIMNYNLKSNDVEDTSLKARLDKAIEYISKLDFSNLKIGKYDVSSDFYYSVQEYMSFGENENKYESHKKHIDIQWVYEGTEKMYVTDINGLFPSDEYDEERDVIHYYAANNMAASILVPGSCIVLFPKDAHRPSLFINKRCTIKKVVGKLLIK